MDLNVLSVESTHAKYNMKKRIGICHMDRFSEDEITSFLFYEVDDTSYIFLTLQWTRTNDSYTGYLFMRIARLRVNHYLFFILNFTYNSSITLVGIGPWT